MKEDLFQPCRGFQWDGANIEKNWGKHRVHWQECEQMFFNDPLLLHDDIDHSDTEARFFALGQTDQRRELMIVFTIRENLIRVISARPMSRKERQSYADIKKTY